MRALLTLLHRWFGLFIAVFLAIAGATGALIAWDHELDAMLSPKFYHAVDVSQGKVQPMTSLQLADKLESEHPELKVSFMGTAIEPGEAHNLFVVPTNGVEGSLGYNQVAMNPYTGEIQAKRQWGEPVLAADHLMPFIYKLHYSLHIPSVGGTDLGMLLMGIIGIVWFLDCFIALSISFPSLAQWRKSFAFRWRASNHKLTFDLHRSGGVWVWGLLLVMAITSISMNLGHQVMRPLVNALSPITPTPFETQALSEAKSPTLNREAVTRLAEAEALKLGINKPLGGLFYGSQQNIYQVMFYQPGYAHGDWGLGNPSLYFDGASGKLLGTEIPGEGSAGDIFVQLQFPLHSGRILGVGGRVLVTLLGLMVTTLSVTGIIIWARKRLARKTIMLRGAMGAELVNG
ncbi:peptidase [Cellvibrio zantedeschiae]|uniref:Peptidase n=1 Tax=Cellvibrio zantedeschiae TaxID=1237077 RepID=A0ABQ3B6H6_9GAMM|nr:PepSY-associated TM helix domain-containing protein [Cellvibrio zantedeschiae]GGY77243.1 peptidase [Cellvibrio zantedeschiae]